MSRQQSSLSATNLAVYHHLNCDLYLHNVYHKTSHPTTPSIQAASENQLLDAQYQRGIDWETTLYSWLDNSNLFLRVPAIPLEADTLLENILADDRDHFFIAGLTFNPPRAQLAERFAKAGTDPVNFGLGKLDLLEITRSPQGVIWKVIDAKASKAIKTSHHVQIYFYTLCLKHNLQHSFFKFSGQAGVWLPPADGFNTTSPSFEDIKTIDLALLSPSLDVFLFERLPKLLSLPRDYVRWHFNPLCQGCNYKDECSSRAVEDGKIGSMPNISLGDARTIQELINLAEQLSPCFTRTRSSDIEDLHMLISDPMSISLLEKRSPIIMKKARQVLGLPRRRMKEENGIVSSPAVDAAIRQTIQLIPRRNFTCPSREDIAVIVSLVQDPASPKPNLEFFCMTLFPHSKKGLPVSHRGIGDDFVSTLASVLRNLTAIPELPSIQFYVWSSNEQALLQSHLIKAALTSNADRTDIRVCIGALAQGASLLHTSFQPILMSGALLDFLGKGNHTRAEYQACLERMDLPVSGTVSELRSRVVQELQRLQGMGASTNQAGKQKEFGQLPRVVVLKKEVERLLALPIPGYWDLPECVSILLGTPGLGTIPSDEDIFSAFRSDHSKSLLGQVLATRNQAIHDALFRLRTHVNCSGLDLLVNEGKALSTDFMDICRHRHLRKLFFMQQFEVLSKLNELWTSRIDGCPDAPTLEYQSVVPGSKGMVEHSFRLVTGTVDAASSDKDFSFFDKLLVEDTFSDTEIPLEAMFDDLALSGLIIPLKRWTKAHWMSQHPLVQEGLLLADVRNVVAFQGKQIVTIHTWGTTSQKLIPGRRYRLSPRLVDFNTRKVLACLFEMDQQWENREDLDGTVGSQEEDHRGVPFLQLFMDPKSFGKVPQPEESLKIENEIQKLFRTLKNLDIEAADSLLLKPSQRRATQRLLANRLSVIWGPPGTGKTHTIALSLLRLLDTQWRIGDRGLKIIFITAMTHAAIDACQGKLERLIGCYRSIQSLPMSWLDNVRIQRVTNGSNHPEPPEAGDTTHIYAGTLYQLYNFSKAHTIQVDCVIADEAGQIALSALSLVLRSLAPSGRIVIAGDSEQLAPIFTGTYPQLQSLSLFGSVLDCLMFSRDRASLTAGESQESEDHVPSTQGAIIQLTENFRLNPDLGEFVSTIYSRKFKPQKVQARRLALVLRGVEQMKTVDIGVRGSVCESVQAFILGLSDVMLRVPQTVLMTPRLEGKDVKTKESIQSRELGVPFDHLPVSLSLLRLKTWSAKSEQFGYEAHVHGEAAVAAALVACITFCSPEDDIFIATPHRMQREAVKSALARLRLPGEALHIGKRLANVTVDTIERLQGSEASFVICLFSLPDSHMMDLGFLLERRRLNVAISRAKTLCILVASSQVLCPPVTVFANEETAKGFAFLKAFEDRAWSYNISVNLDQM